VRYKIPSIPFYVCSLFIIAKTYEDLKKEDAIRFALKRDEAVPKTELGKD
jgi:hypothetical protein